MPLRVGCQEVRLWIGVIRALHIGSERAIQAAMLSAGFASSDKPIIS